ncbi:peptidoglycan DD-metalloendopeptidase family protein [Acetobacter suratthaniensis]|uniref:Peptidoglycan DD-metalloendopeptidase family protein n=2 Tax=Acetobacter suratthaniensis TaxID=1502841 RepID=A0ABS3LI50_9PROT|nr:peptidoglycan DD-metalloendopeptidase family protein [Acetobacter suratthaniensis]
MRTRRFFSFRPTALSSLLRRHEPTGIRLPESRPGLSFLQLRGAFCSGLIALAACMPVTAYAAPADTAHKPHHTGAHRARHAPASTASGSRSVVQARHALENARARHEAAQAATERQAAAVAASRARQDAAIAAAATARTQAHTLSAATLSATAQLQDTEQQIADLSDRMDATHQEQQALSASLLGHEQALAPILPLAVRLSAYPSDTLLAAPLPQNDAVTGFLVLRGLSRQLQDEARDLREKQARLAVLDHDLSTQKTRLEALEQQQASERATVRRQADQARKAQKRADSAARVATQALQAAMQRASSLQDAVARLEALQTDAESRLHHALTTIPAPPRATHTLTAPTTSPSANTQSADTQDSTQDSTAEGPGLNAQAGAASGLKPVAGTLISAWGTTTESGPATGMTYRTPPGASVRAPCSGGVDFAGVFRTYGRMVILNCGRHYRFILAGLSELSVDTGQDLTKGAPIGHMGNAGGSARLFIQLRHGQQSVNPAPFL